MTFVTRIKAFLAREDGALTGDFLVLTGAILVAGMFVVATVMPPITDFSDRSTKVEASNPMITQFVNATAESD